MAAVQASKTLPEIRTEKAPGTNRNAGLRRWWWCITWMMVAIVLSGSFARRAMRDETISQFPYHWTAHWIQAPFDAPTVSFRKEVMVGGRVRNAYLIVAVDNAFDLTVNGLSVPGSFRSSSSYVLTSINSAYDMVGNTRKWVVASTFNLQRMLRPGRNVINIVAETDSVRPYLIAEGEIYASAKVHITTDSSWKCTPTTQMNWTTGWWNADPNVDANWQHAEVTNALPYLMVDGDVNELETPAQGRFITTPSPVSFNASTYRYRIKVSSYDASGWVRLVTRVPFDMSLNGVPVLSNSRPVVQWIGPPSRHNMDRLPRLVSGAQPGSGNYPAMNTQYRTNTVFLIHVLQSGWNTLQVTTHDTAGVVLRGTPSEIEVDGRIRQSDGKIIRLVSGPDWEAWSGGTYLGHAISVATPHGLDVFDTNSYKNSPSSRIGPGIRLGTRLAKSTRLASLVTISLVMLILAAVGTFLPGKPILLLANTIFVPALILIFAALLQTSFEQTIWSHEIDSPITCTIVLVTAVVTWLVAILYAIARRWVAAPDRIDSSKNGQRHVPGGHTSESPSTLESNAGAATIDRWVQIVGLGAILVTATIFYWHALDRFSFLGDEYVSLLAARGIARHGFPLFEATGIIYTRSSLYHYLLAILVGKSGDPDPNIVRGLAAAWQLATIVVVFLFGRSIRDYRVGLIASAFVALSPTMMFYAREVRFYTQESFFITLAFYALWKSVQDQDRLWPRLLVCIAYSAAYLSQQLALAALPPILIVIFLNRRVRKWFTGWTLVGVIGAVGVMVADYVAYLKWTQTPLPFVDTDSVILLGFHTDFLETEVAMLLLGKERSQIIVGSLYAIGLAMTVLWSLRGSRRSCDGAYADNNNSDWHAARDRSHNAGVYLYGVSLPLMAITAMITPRPNERYAMHTYPIIALAAAWAVAMFVSWVREYLTSRHETSRRDIATVCGLAIVVLALVCYRPLEMWTDTTRAVVAGLTQSTRFVRAAERPGDKIISFGPEAAIFDIGHCDYFWRQIRGSLFLYTSTDGVLRERNSAAVLLNTTDKLIDVISRHPRVWMIIPQWMTTPNLGYQSDFSDFLQANFVMMYQGDGMQVWLWDKSLNHYKPTVHQYGSLGPGFVD